MAESENFVFLFYLYYVLVLFIVCSPVLNIRKLLTIDKREGRRSKLAVSKCS